MPDHWADKRDLDDGEDTGNRTHMHCWWECMLEQSFWKTLALPPKVKHHVTMRPRDLTPTTDPRGRVGESQALASPEFTAALFQRLSGDKMWP